jgi:hypothetical protein
LFYLSITYTPIPVNILVYHIKFKYDLTSKWYKSSSSPSTYTTWNTNFFNEFSQTTLLITPLTGIVSLSTTKEGEVAVFKTAGNIDSHIILRGGKNPNYSPESIAETLTALTEAEVNESIMGDASHGNSQKIFKNQISVIS